MEGEKPCNDIPSGREALGGAFQYTMPDAFLTSESVQETLENFIDKMVDIHDQEGLNQMYNEFCQTLKAELVCRKVSSGECYHKPWWNDCLAALRKKARNALAQLPW